LVSEAAISPREEISEVASLGCWQWIPKAVKVGAKFMPSIVMHIDDAAAAHREFISSVHV
jgi:hypothetical protein